MVVAVVEKEVYGNRNIVAIVVVLSVLVILLVVLVCSCNKSKYITFHISIIHIIIRIIIIRFLYFA